MESMYTELELINGLKKRDVIVVKHLYVTYYPMIRDLIQKNGGSEEDASDVFQEGMVVVFEKTQDKNFNWSSSIKTYLYAVCRNKWLMHLRRQRTHNTTYLQDNVEVAGDQNVQRDIVHQEKRELMRKHFGFLGDDCQTVLRMFFAGNSMRKIAQEMGFTEAYAKKRKFTCQQKLIQAISLDPLFNELSAS
ncbi:MAG: sigma-70 family RNA polymerase sigma factor [Saprospiraceae bacterium]|nr:sigma-70 family RNA polymerase sigma factor [Saprospiraceae bacterium]